MKATDFSEANCTYQPPKTMSLQQCVPVRTYKGTIEGGSLDGETIVVVRYELDENDLANLKATGELFISMVGGLAPHYPSASFFEATHPA